MRNFSKIFSKKGSNDNIKILKESGLFPLSRKNDTL